MLWTGLSPKACLSRSFNFEVISTTLKACLGVLPVLLILGLREYSRKCYTTFAGVLPQKCCSASGSTPVLKKQSVGPLLWEYSRKSGIVLPGVLPKRLFLYTGSDLDMIYSFKALVNKIVNSNSLALNLVRYISKLSNTSSSVTVNNINISINHGGLDNQKQNR